MIYLRPLNGSSREGKRVNSVLACFLTGPFLFLGCATRQQLPRLIQNPRTAKDYCKRGDYFYSKMQFYEAIPEYTQAIALKPDYTDAYPPARIQMNGISKWKDLPTAYSGIETTKAIIFIWTTHRRGHNG